MARLDGRADDSPAAMRTRFRMDSAGMGKGVRRFLAQGPPARLAACVVVALAAIVWLGIAFVVLRALVVAVLVLAGIWCAWLVATVWRGDRERSEERRVGRSGDRGCVCVVW